MYKFIYLFIYLFLFLFCLQDQIQRAQSYQRTLKNRLKTYAHGIDPTQFKSIENQWVEVQVSINNKNLLDTSSLF